jgi:hypothetical protein
MLDLSYRKRLVDTYNKARQNEKFRISQNELDRVLALGHPDREHFFVEWARGGCCESSMFTLGGSRAESNEGNNWWM